MPTPISAIPEVAPSANVPKAYTAVAPWWHTLLFVAIVVTLSILQSRPSVVAHATALPSRIPIYAGTLAYEVALFLYVWLLGLRLRRVPMRDIIGGKWARLEDFLIDVATAIGFWIVVVAVLAIVQIFVKYNGVKAARELLPQTPAEVAAFLVLSVTAGFCEEFVFRGYLQRQFLALAQNAPVAIALQALVFAVGHLYQGWRPVIAITVYGALFGILAWYRKTLRPGMIQHAAQDTISGIVGGILLRRKLI
jgi:membrane protease YdiL (CAAX protease family)